MQAKYPPLEICYILKYPELKFVGKGEERKEMWVIRQVGVYQQYSKKTCKAVWLLLHCGPDTKAQSAVKELLTKTEQAQLAWKDPAVLHLALSACYLSKWRAYMSFFEFELIKKVRIKTSAYRYG
jgi:hypothetical protein